MAMWSPTFLYQTIIANADFTMGGRCNVQANPSSHIERSDPIERDFKADRE